MRGRIHIILGTFLVAHALGTVIVVNLLAAS